MSAWNALLWGAHASSSLYIGYALAGPLAGNRKAIGLLMGFGAGTLVSAVGYQLVPQASFEHGIGVGISFALGALTYYVADRTVDGQGGEDRQDLDVQEGTGSPWAMFIGALLDGIPESFVLGITLALGGTINVAFLAAVFVSNIPQGVAGNRQPARGRSTQQAHYLELGDPDRGLRRDRRLGIPARRQRPARGALGRGLRGQCRPDDARRLDDARGLPTRRTRRRPHHRARIPRRRRTRRRAMTLDLHGRQVPSRSHEEASSPRPSQM
jgi:hypothetical protein